MDQKGIKWLLSFTAIQSIEFETHVWDFMTISKNPLIRVIPDLHKLSICRSFFLPVAFLHYYIQFKLQSNLLAKAYLIDVLNNIIIDLISGTGNTVRFLKSEPVLTVFLFLNPRFEYNPGSALFSFSSLCSCHSSSDGKWSLRT